jgi:curved DNA-binding protein CbpA
MNSYYFLLSVNEFSSLSDIKKSYHELAKKYHPDKGIKDSRKFREVNVAYDWLKKNHKKKVKEQQQKPLPSSDELFLEKINQIKKILQQNTDPKIVAEYTKMLEKYRKAYQSGISYGSYNYNNDYLDDPEDIRYWKHLVNYWKKFADDQHKELKLLRSLLEKEKAKGAWDKIIDKFLIDKFLA